MALHSLFQTLVYQARLTVAPARRTLCRDITREASIIAEIDEAGDDWSKTNYQNGYTSYASMDRLHKQFPPFAELETKIDRHVAAFVRKQNWDLGAGRLKMANLWLNVMGPGTVHSWHLHPLSVVSGSFYVSVPKGSSPIKFEDPRLDRFMAQPPRKLSAPRAQQPFIEIEPKTGDVILFESWLRHEVPQVPKPKRGRAEPRISVSFNYDWVR